MAIEDTTEKIVERELSEGVGRHIAPPVQPAKVKEEARWFTLDEIRNKPPTDLLEQDSTTDWAAKFKESLADMPQIFDSTAKPKLDEAVTMTVDPDGTVNADVDFDEPEVSEHRQPTTSEFIAFMYKENRALIYAAAFSRKGMYRQMDAKLSVELADKEYFANIPEEHLELKASENPVGKFLGESAAMMPFIMETFKKGLKVGIPLALIYAGKKSLIKRSLGMHKGLKFILSAEALAAGLKTGFAFAVIKTSIDVEGATIFADLIKAGVDEKTASKLAIAAGLMIGLTELAQLTMFAATYRRIFGKNIKGEVAQKAIKVALIASLEAVGYNPAQEVIQEIIEMATIGLAKVIDDNPHSFPKNQGVWSRLLDVWIRTTQGSVALGILAAVGGGMGQRSRNRRLTREAYIKVVLEAKEARKEDIIKVTLPEGVNALSPEGIAMTKKIAQAQAEAYLQRDDATAATPEEEKAAELREEAIAQEAISEKIQVRVADVEEKHERGEIDRRTLDRRKIDILAFESTEAFIKGINDAKRENLPDKVIAYIVKNPENFSASLVEFAEMTAIPKGTPAIQVEKIIERRAEARRVAERRDAGRAAQAEQARILRGEEVTELSEAQKRALRIAKAQEKLPVVTEIEGSKTLAFKRKDIPARITYLKDQNKDIDKLLDRILTKVAHEKLEANVKKFHTDTLRLLEEQAKNLKEMQELALVNTKLEFDLGAKKVTLRASEVIALQMDAIKKMIAGIEKGKKIGARITRKQIRELQVSLVNFIKQTETDVMTRKNALASIARVQTEVQADAMIAKFKKQVDAAAEKALKRLLIENIKKLSKNRKLAKVSEEFKTQIEAILAPFTVVNPTAKTRASLVWAAKTLRENNANQISGEELAILRELDKTPLIKLSVRDLQLVHDSVAHLIHLNTEKQKLNAKERTDTQESNLKQAVDNIRDQSEKLDHAVSGVDDMFTEHETKLFKGFGLITDMLGAAAWNTELISEILDGKDDGIIMQVFYNAIDDGEAVAINYRTDSENFFKANGMEKLIDQSWSASFTRRFKKVKQTVFTQENGQTINLTRGNRIAFILLGRNENSRRQLLEGGFVFARSKHATATRLSKADLAGIEETATKEELRVAEIMSQYFNTFQKERLNEVFERLFGFAVAVEDNYFPAHVSELARKVSIEEYKGLASSDEFVRNVLENLGIFKKKKGGTETLVINDAFDVVTDSIRKTSNFIGIAEPLRNAKALLNAPEFKAEVINAGKGKYLESLKDYLEKVEGSVFNNDNIGKLAQNWQSKIDVAVLAGNVWVFMKQPVSFWLASTEINMAYLIAGQRPVTSQTLVDEINKWSPHLRERFQGNITLETGEIAGMGATRRLFLGKTLMSQKAMIGIHKFDKQAIASIWRAVKMETRSKHPELKGDAYFEHVADRAWKIIRRTQPTFSMKDRSYVGRTSNTKLRLVTKYTSQRNKNLMIQRRMIARYNRSEGGAKALSSLVGGMVMVNLIASSMIAGVNALRGLGKKETNDEEWNFWVSYGVDVVRTIIGNTYIIGNILDIALTKVVERKKGFGMTDPVSRAFEQTGELIGDIGRGIQSTVGDKPRYRQGRVKAEKEREKLVERIIRNSLDLASKIKGLPIYSTLRTFEIISRATGLVEDDEDTRRYKRRRY